MPPSKIVAQRLRKWKILLFPFYLNESETTVLAEMEDIYFPFLLYTVLANRLPLIIGAISLVFRPTCHNTKQSLRLREAQLGDLHRLVIIGVSLQSHCVLETSNLTLLP